MNTLRFFGMFEGIGGFRIAAEMLGWQSIGYCENDPDALETYRANFKTEDEFFHADAKTLDPTQIPDFDILFAGFPCQPFSVAGKLLGFKDTRGTLFFDILRVLSSKRPPYFLLENVANLEKHGNGITLHRMLGLLASSINGNGTLETNETLGYSVFWSILNAQDFGVPQRRRRVFIVGFHDGHDSFEFPKPTNQAACFRDVKENLADYSKYMMPRTPSRVKMVKECPILKDDSVAATLTTKNDRWRNVGLVPLGDWYRFTTEREIARLQGFPDSFKPHPNYHLAEKQFGNAVAVPVVRAILEAVASSP